MQDAPRAGGSNLDVLAKYQAIRSIFLAGPYDALLTIEDDIIVPSNAIAALTAINADIVYGLYVWRSAGHRWNATTELNERGGVSISQSNPQGARELLQSGGVGLVAGMGNGCTLLQRRVIEAIPFRVDHRNRAAQDWCMARDAAERGFRQVCHYGVVCGHVEIKSQFRVFWPDAGPELYREEIAE
jgi:hypothetical protein